MSWRIYRYFFKEISPYFLLTLLVATSLVFAYEAGRFAELFVKRNVPPTLVHTLLGAILARVLIITLPISLLVGTLLALSRMGNDNELISLYSSGMSRRHIAAPLICFAMFVASILGFLTLIEFPNSAKRIREIRGQLILQGIRTQVQPRVFDNRFIDRILYIRDIDREKDIWNGIFLSSTEFGQHVLITSQYGILELGEQPESSSLHLFNGVAHRKERNSDGHEVYNVEGFSSYHVRFDPQSREAAKFQLEAQGRPEPIEEKSFIGLIQNTNIKHKDHIKAYIEAGRRLALPFACLLFAPLGLGLGIRRHRTGRSLGFIVGIILATGYYLLLFAGERLAMASILHPMVAMWVANVVFAWFAIYALRDKGAFPWGDQIWAFTERIGEWSRFRKLGGNEAEKATVMIRVVDALRRVGWKVTRLISVYIIGDFLRFFLLFLVSLWMVFMVFTLFELSPDVIEHQINIGSFIEYFVYLSPQILLHLTPPCILLAAVLAIGLLSRTNQFVALKAHGISAYRLSLPILTTSLVIMGGVMVLQEYVVPKTNIRQEQIRFYIKKGRFPTTSEVSSLTLTDGWVFGQTNRLFHFNAFDHQNNEFHQLLVLDLEDEVQMFVNRRIEANRATWDSQRAGWQLEDVHIWVFDRDQAVENLSLERYFLRIIESPDYFKKDDRKPDYMSSSELVDYLRKLERRGIDATELRIALQKKYALAGACLAMALTGLPFGFTFGRKGALYGVGLGISLGLVYWMGTFLFEGLGKYGYIKPTLASWGPVGLLAAVGLYALFRVKT